MPDHDDCWHDLVLPHLREDPRQQRGIARLRGGLKDSMVEGASQRRVTHVAHLHEDLQGTLNACWHRGQVQALYQNGAGVLVRTQSGIAHLRQEAPNLPTLLAAHSRVHHGVESDGIRSQSALAHAIRNLDHALEVVLLGVALHQDVIRNNVQDGGRGGGHLRNQSLNGNHLVCGHAGRQDHIDHEAVNGNPPALHVAECFHRRGPVLELAVHPQHRHVRANGRCGARCKLFEEVDCPVELAHLGSKVYQTTAGYYGRLKSITNKSIIEEESKVVLLLARELLHGALVEVE
mmetsp:Transcript_27097/g.84285  ORF Transcript_27097/g.84285 Transcript_27097/m.84285 type:complete len:291 (+) Transcript_27097:221-1093(+)